MQMQYKYLITYGIIGKQYQKRRCVFVRGKYGISRSIKFIYKLIEVKYERKF